jgi:hypothetical protein
MADYQVSLGRCDKRELVLMLAAIKARIGTPGELSGDRARSRSICEHLHRVHEGSGLPASIRKMDWDYRAP